MKKYFIFGALTLLLASVTNAATLEEITSLDCSNKQGSFLQLVVSKGVILGKLDSKEFTSQGMDVVEVLEDFPDEKSDGLGGLVDGEIGFGSAVVTFTKKQRNNLNKAEDSKLIFVDMDGKKVSENVKCQLEFQ